jgi:hypothetical protein
MPPQQRDRLLDLLDDGRDFRAHYRAPTGDVTISEKKRNASGVLAPVLRGESVNIIRR